MKPLLVVPKYAPPETYAGHIASRVNPQLGDYTHVIIVDADMKVPQEFYELPTVYSDADIVAPKVIPASRLIRVWEVLTYGVRLSRLRLRGGAVIYSTAFLKRVGGYPVVTAPDTWLYTRAGKVVQAPMKAYHMESFSLKHSIDIQKQRGKARAEMKQSALRVAAHSFFRLRPLILFYYLYYRLRTKN